MYCSYTRGNSAFPVWQTAKRSNIRISRYISKFAPKWGRCGEILSKFKLSAEYLNWSLPERYKTAVLTKICGVPDGKDFEIETPRTNTVLTRAAYSNKIHGSATRCITWSTPSGLTYDHTPMFLGRVSEKRLVELWGPRFDHCPPGWEMLADKGFAGTARFYANLSPQRTPHFLGKRSQFTSGEVQDDLVICRLRYTCEVIFSRVANDRCLQDRIRFEFFPLLDYALHWGHAHNNLMKQLCR